MAWKPREVRLRRAVAVGSSIPWATKVRISGNRAASSGSRIGDSSTRKSLSVPSGYGRASRSGSVAAASERSAGARASRFSSALTSTSRARKCRGSGISQSPPRGGRAWRDCRDRSRKGLSAAKAGAHRTTARTRRTGRRRADIEILARANGWTFYSRTALAMAARACLAAGSRSQLGDPRCERRVAAGEKILGRTGRQDVGLDAPPHQAGADIRRRRHAARASARQSERQRIPRAAACRLSGDEDAVLDQVDPEGKIGLHPLGELLRQKHLGMPVLEERAHLLHGGIL